MVGKLAALPKPSHITQLTANRQPHVQSRGMDTPFERIPDLLDVPAVRWLYPFQYERNWTVTSESAFFQESLPMAFVVCAVYCVMCFAGRRVMFDIKPFDLKVPLALWNLGLATFSAIGASRTAPFLLNTIYHCGVYHSMCAPITPHYGRGHVALWAVLFIYSKVPELLDTAFIVLRKKPLIFLHWYHHVTVLLFCWHGAAKRSSSGLYFIAMNYSVHAIMYFYYFLTACGYRPRWARLVTIFQLSQMGVGVAVCSLNVYYLKQGDPCGVDPDNLKWAIIMYSSYFALFLKFFIDRYLLCSAKKPAAEVAKKTQ